MSSINRISGAAILTALLALAPRTCFVYRRDGSSTLRALHHHARLAGNDLRDMQQNIKDILMNKEVIAVDQDKLGKQGVRVAKEGALEVRSKPLADGGYAVGLFNRSAGTAKITAKWSDVGVKGSRAVRDLWAHQDLGKLADAFSADVPSHGVVMVRIAK